MLAEEEGAHLEVGGALALVLGGFGPASHCVSACVCVCVSIEGYATPKTYICAGVLMRRCGAQSRFSGQRVGRGKTSCRALHGTADELSACAPLRARPERSEERRRRRASKCDLHMHIPLARKQSRIRSASLNRAASPRRSVDTAPAPGTAVYSWAHLGTTVHAPRWPRSRSVSPASSPLFSALSHISPRPRLRAHTGTPAATQPPAPKPTFSETTLPLLPLGPVSA